MRFDQNYKVKKFCEDVILDIIRELRTLRPKLIPNPIWLKLKRLFKYNLVPGALTYNQDGLATRHNCSFINNTRFSHAYAQGKATGSWGVPIFIGVLM